MNPLEMETRFISDAILGHPTDGTTCPQATGGAGCASPSDRFLVFPGGLRSIDNLVNDLQREKGANRIRLLTQAEDKERQQWIAAPYPHMPSDTEM